MEYGEKPEETPMSEREQAALTLKLKELCELFGNVTTSDSTIPSLLPDDTPEGEVLTVFEDPLHPDHAVPQSLVVHNLGKYVELDGITVPSGELSLRVNQSKAFFEINGSYVSVLHSAEFYTYPSNPHETSTVETFHVQVASGMNDGVHTYWNVESYTLGSREDTPYYSEELYSDELSANGLWTHFWPAPLYDLIMDKVPLSDKDKAKQREKSVLTKSRYARIMALLSKLEASHYQSEIPEFFSQTAFSLRRM